MKKKILVIGAAVLIVLLALTPVVNSTTLNVTTKCTSRTEDANWDKIYDVLETHQEDIEEINQYVNDYIAKHGYMDWNFVLPDELQAKFDAILEEIGIEPEKTAWKERPAMQYPILSNLGNRLVQRLYLLMSRVGRSSFTKTPKLIFGACSASTSNMKTVVETVKDSSEGLCILSILGEDGYVEFEIPYPTLDWDLEMRDVWLSTKPKDWDKEHVIDTPTSGQSVYFYWDFYTHGEGEFPACCIEVRLDGKLYGESCGHVFEGGKHYMGYWSEPWDATVGKHTVMVELDSQKDVPESNEGNNVGSYQFTVEDGEDGITKIEFTNLWIWFIWLGFKAELWMSHHYIENNLEPAFAYGAVGIALLILALGTVTMGIAWIFGAFLMGQGIEGIDDCDQGRGVYILFALGLITVFPPRMEPQ